METTVEYYLHVDVSRMDDATLAAKFEIVNKLRAKEKDNSLDEIKKLITGKL